MSTRGVSAGNVLPAIRRNAEAQPPLAGPRRLQVHSVVEDTTAAIAAATDLDMALRALLVGVHRLTGADIGGVRLPLDADHLIGPCRVFYFGGTHDGTWQNQETLPASNVAQVYTSGCGEYTPDLQAEARTGDEAARRALTFREIRSSLIVPLRAGGRVIGSLHADAREPNAFRTAQLRPLQVLADHAGGAVDQARWREEANARLQRLLVVERVSAAVNDAGDLDDLLQRVLDAAADLVDTQRAQIALVDADRQVIRGRVGRDLPPGMLEATVRPLFPGPDPAEDIFALVVRTGKQVVTDDSHPALHAPTKTRFGLTSLHRVFTPIAHGGETFGVLAIIWRRPPSPADSAILRLVAEQAGGAIARARLVEAERAQFQARLQAEAVLRESESRFRQAFQYSAAGMALVALDGHYLQVNAALCRMLGYGEGDLLSTTFTAITHPDDRAADANLVGQLLRREVDFFVQEKRYLRQDNAVVWVFMSVSLVREANGQPSYFVSQVQDVTERKRAEAALARQVQSAEAARAETRATLDTTGEAMLLVAPDGAIRSMNQRFSEFFLLREEQALNRPLADFTADFTRIFGTSVPLDGLAAHIADPAQKYTRDLAQVWPVARTLELCSTPVLVGELTLGRLFAFRDVTREREADRVKDEFVATVSHELRTPLTSIKGYVDLLLGGEVGDLPNEQREFLEIIQRNADREVALVNNLLDLSRLEAGIVAIDHRPLELTPLLVQIVASLRPQLAAKRQLLTLDLPGDVPPVAGDAARLTQVFTNLMVNAHKYTPVDGQIIISAGVTEESLRIDVRDTGIGLSSEEQSHLFTKFYRARNRLTQAEGGTGLGLTITRALVEQHGGQISVTSTPGQGSTFSVSLPRLLVPLAR